MAMFGLHSLSITPETLSLIAEIDEFKGVWRVLGGLEPERLRRLRTVATIESVGSSTRIEGAKLSDREVEALLGRLQADSFATRDEQEVAGYASVMEAIFANHEVIPITENYIRQLHAMLLRYSEKDERHRGNYKTLSNQVEAFDETGQSLGVIFETTSPFDTPREMHELVEWYNQTTQEKTLHPLIVTGIFIVVFLAIHPFQDGNGRLSRVLTTLLLLKAGYAYVPYCSLESVVEQNKDTYYLALRRTQGTLRSATIDWSPWLTFFLQTLQKQKRRLEAKIEREKLIRATMSPLAMSILELITNHGTAAVADIIRATGSSRGTIKKTLAGLVESGYLRQTGKARATRYVAR